MKKIIFATVLFISASPLLCMNKPSKEAQESSSTSPTASTICPQENIIGTNRQKETEPQKELSFEELKKLVDQLYTALSKNDEAALEIILSTLKTDINTIIDVFDRTPLHLSACVSNAGITKKLIQYKADPNARDAIGQTPLHCALDNEKEPEKTVRMLLENHANPNARDEEGETPLFEAITRYRSEIIFAQEIKNIIKILLEYKADPDLLNGSDKTVLNDKIGSSTTQSTAPMSLEMTVGTPTTTTTTTLPFSSSPISSSSLTSSLSSGIISSKP